MATLTLRTIVNRSLTNQEVDDNFTNLNTDVIDALDAIDVINNTTIPTEVNALETLISYKQDLDNKLTSISNIGSKSFDTGDVNTTTDVITITSHGYTTGNAVYYNSQFGTVAGGLTNGATYYVRVLSSSTINLYDTQEHALDTAVTTGLINLTTVGNDDQRLIKSTPGLLSITGDTVTPRTLTSATSLLVVTNGDGVSGNPTINVGADILTTTNTKTVSNKTISGNNNTISNVSLTASVSGILPIANGGTNASTEADARANLNVLVQPSANGIAVRTSLGNSAAREIAISGSGISIANGSGVGGNPTITLASNTANSNNTVVLRDGSGNFAANVVTVSRLTAQNIVQLPNQSATNASPAEGQIRYNSSTAKFEGYTDQWKPIDTRGAAVGGDTDEVFFENQTTVNYNYQITNGRNAMSVGPITILPGVTVTIGAGQRWVIL
jgi:hypothetical protein